MTYTTDLVAIIDEDSMVSNTNSAVPTQQSVKTYVDRLQPQVTITVPAPAITDEPGLGYTNSAITITKIVFVTIGSTPSINATIRFATDRSAAGTEVVTGGTTVTSTTTGNIVTSFNDATIPGSYFIWVELSSITGTVDQLEISVFYTFDA